MCLLYTRAAWDTARGSYCSFVLASNLDNEFDCIYNLTDHTCARSPTVPRKQSPPWPRQSPMQSPASTVTLHVAVACCIIACCNRLGRAVSQSAQEELDTLPFRRAVW